jgi:FdhD protein
MNIKAIQTLRLEAGAAQEIDDHLSVEEALQICINGEPYSITMRTPGDDEKLVRGLLFSEAVVSDPAAEIRFDPADSSVYDCDRTINVLIDEKWLDKSVDASHRSLASNSSCGVCGKRDLKDIQIEEGLAALRPERKLDPGLIAKMRTAMAAQQKTFRASGGSHAAAVFSLMGEMLSVHEDVGRHNAVDKVIGALLEDKSLDQGVCLFVSGRISFEIVSKAFHAGLVFLLAVSAPTSMAVETAERWGITLLGFCRDNRATVYSHSENLEINQESVNV